MQVNELCRQIAHLCKTSDEEKWADLFNSFADKIEYDGIESCKNAIRSMYGGMGSFNDLVLQKGEQINVDANNSLDVLRVKLFEMIH